MKIEETINKELVATHKLLKKFGFEFNGDFKATKTTQRLVIEVDIFESGKFEIREIKNITNDNNVELIRKLVKIY